jgi:hypothetical protein
MGGRPQRDRRHQDRWPIEQLLIRGGYVRLVLSLITGALMPAKRAHPHHLSLDGSRYCFAAPNLKLADSLVALNSSRLLQRPGFLVPKLPHS